VTKLSNSESFVYLSFFVSVRGGISKMSFVFNVKAQTVPAILIVVGAFLMVTGESLVDPLLTNAGWTCIGLGVLVEVLYIISMIIIKA